MDALALFMRSQPIDPDVSTVRMTFFGIELRPCGAMCETGVFPILYFEWALTLQSRPRYLPTVPPRIQRPLIQFLPKLRINKLYIFYQSLALVLQVLLSEESPSEGARE